MSYVGVAVQPDSGLGKTSDRLRGIRWSLLSTLDDLDFADDLAPLSHTHQHMQEKTTRLSMFTQQVGLNVSQKESEVMMLNVSNPSPVKVNRKALPITEVFTYLGSIVRHDGGASNDIRRMLEDDRKRPRSTVHLPHQEP